MKGKTMKKIMFRGEQVEVPFEDADYRLDGEKDVEIQNPFSGEKATVPAYAAEYVVDPSNEPFKYICRAYEVLLCVKTTLYHVLIDTVVLPVTAPAEYGTSANALDL